MFIIGLTIGLIVFFIFSKDGFIDLLNSGLKINVLWLIIGLCLYFLNIVLDTYIIYLFVRRSTPSFTLWQAVIVSMVGQFYCAVTPGASGGQPMQVLTMTRMNVKASNATAALIQKFLVWQFTLTGSALNPDFEGCEPQRCGMIKPLNGSEGLNDVYIGLTLQ